MEAPVPMDRLLYGDVGYGETEVAVEAAFKAVMDGKQVGVLVPTTLLASSTWPSSPTASPPSRSRWRCCRAGQWEQDDVVAGMADGTIDVVIGTRTAAVGRRQVVRPRPGRGRRGAPLRRRPQGHLKQLRTEVDVLTLTATRSPGPWRWPSPASATCR